MARLSRDCVITEKIDGTNAQILITENGDFFTGSRKRWITPDDDNFGFSQWAHEHKEQLMQLGPGRHFGEWWGQGIQRKYGLGEKRFSLFNTLRWNNAGETPRPIPNNNPKEEVKYTRPAPGCCSVVPILFQGVFDTDAVDQCLLYLRTEGSYAAPGFMNPEGVVVYHIAGNIGFKKTIENDGQPKGQV